MVVLMHSCLDGFFGAVRRQLYSLSFCGMTARAFGTTLRTATFATALILGISASPAGADGVEANVTIETLDGITVLDPETAQTASGQLATPAVPVTVRIESDSDDTDSSGVNVPLVFGVGAGIGVAIAVIRKRLRSR
jgi:hypothetical protein